MRVLRFISPVWLTVFTLGFSGQVFGKDAGQNSNQKHSHDYGQVTLASHPQKIAALNWTQTEFLLSLGITP